MWKCRLCLSWKQRDGRITHEQSAKHKRARKNNPLKTAEPVSTNILQAATALLLQHNLAPSAPTPASTTAANLFNFDQAQFTTLPRHVRQRVESPPPFDVEPELADNAPPLLADSLARVQPSARDASIRFIEGDLEDLMTDGLVLGNDDSEEEGMERLSESEEEGSEPEGMSSARLMIPSLIQSCSVSGPNPPTPVAPTAQPVPQVRTESADEVDLRELFPWQNKLVRLWALRARSARLTDIHLAILGMFSRHPFTSPPVRLLGEAA